MALPSKCPMCFAKSKHLEVKTAHIYGKKEGAFFKCNNCQVIFQYPFLSKKEEREFYNSEFENFMNQRVGKNSNWNNVEKHINDNKNTYKRRIKYLKKFFTKKKLDILEIGCSSGFMLYPLIKKGFSCNGIEPSGYFSKYLLNKKINLFKNISDIKNKKFDLIMHFFVLEHIKNPIEFLIQQLKLLKRNGKIIFEIPSYSDALSNIYDIPEFERFYWSKAHPWYFNKFSINFLLKKLNKKYSITFDQRYNLSNHIYWSHYRAPGGQNFYSNYFGKKIENTYRKELIKNGYADTIICTIYK